MGGDTNVNYQTFNGNIGDFAGKKLNYGDLVNLDQQMGLSAGNQPTFINGGNIYQVKDAGNGQFSLQQIDTVSNRQQQAAQQGYQAALGSAVGGLQTQKSNLAQQYGDLLKTVTGEYQPLINQATTQENNYLGARGLLSQTGQGGNQLSQSLQGIYGQETANAQQIGAGSISDVNTLTQAIANLQAGGAQFAAGLPLQYGSLNLAQQALPSQIALQQSQAGYYGGINANELAKAQLQYGEPFSVQSGVVFNPSSGKFTQAGGGASPDIMALARAKLGQQFSKRPEASAIGNYITAS